MQKTLTGIPGCFVFQGAVQLDSRGSFYKLFHDPTFEAHGLKFQCREAYITTSRLGVIRGMHFQAPPFEQVKIVSCVGGAALDVLIDLRCGSPAFGRPLWFHLKDDEVRWVYIPAGVAHGFVSLAESTALVYHVSTAYNPEADSGILWNSLPFSWEEALRFCGVTPDWPYIISDRDQSFPDFGDFKSPFTWENEV